MTFILNLQIKKKKKEVIYPKLGLAPVSNDLHL